MKRIDLMSDIKTTGKVSQMFSTARIYCLISIVSAHMYFPGTFATDFLFRLGTVGVTLFLIMAGYFYKPSKFTSIWALLKNKATSLCIPWLFLGSLTWLYNAILSSQFRSVSGYLKWVLGSGTYLYYMPVLLVCFLLFYKAPKFILWLSLPITVTSILLTASGILNSTVRFIGINHYLNIFNWIGFFALGMILQNIDSEKLFLFFKKFGFLNVALFLIAFTLLLVFKDVQYSYFSYIAIPYELIGCMAILSLSTMSLTKFAFFRGLSNISFSIYLLHMPLIGILDVLMNVSEITRLLSPLFIIAVSFAVLFVGQFISKKIRFEKIYILLTGARTSK